MSWREITKSIYILEEDSELIAQVSINRKTFSLLLESDEGEIDVKNVRLLEGVLLGKGIQALPPKIRAQMHERLTDLIYEKTGFYPDPSLLPDSISTKATG